MICSVIVYTGTARQYSLHSTAEMYEQAEPVRLPFSGPDSPQPSGPPPQPSPVRQSGSRGRARHGNGASDKQREDQDTSSHTYENAEDAKRYATSADGAYPGGASGRRGVCSFLRARRSFLAAGIAVLLSLCAVGLAPLTFSNKQGEEGKFEWVDGSALGPYTSWGPGQPTGTKYGGDYDCVLYSALPSRKDKWSDDGCHRTFRFICQAAQERP
ncbi:uncharacterized protein LOC144919467 [Branchiostoma floridae x Branchiostoma belcheri]